MTVWEDVSERIRELARTDNQVGVERFRVRDVDPLVLDGIDSDVRLELGDDDLEVDEIVLGAAEVDDVVIGLRDSDADYVVTGFLRDETGISGASGPAGGDLGGTYPDPQVLKAALDFEAADNIRSYAGTSAQIHLGNNAGIPIIRFGDAADTNLYRSAPDTLKTDDVFIAARLEVAASGGTITGPGYLLLKSGALNDQIIFRRSNDAEVGRFGPDGDLQLAPATKLEWTATAGADNPDTNLYRGAADVLKTDDTFVISRPGGGDNALYTLRGDSAGWGAFVLQADGQMMWGSGSGAVDVALARYAPDVLKLYDAFLFVCAFTSYVADGVWGATASPGGWCTPADATQVRGRFGYDDNGSGAYYPSIGFGAPSSGYAPTMRVLRTRVAHGTPEAHDRFSLQHDGKLLWGGGAATPDVNLYRSAADVLKTDDTFEAATVKSGGTKVVTALAARTLTNWSNATNRVTTLDRNSWTNQQLFDFVATLAYDLQNP